MYTEEQWRALTESEYARLCNSSSEEGWLAGVADYVWNALAVLGMVAVAVVVGLYYAGFFSWAAVAMPRLFGWLS